MKTPVLFCTALLAASLTGCESTSANQRRGAGIGAAAGAVIGGVIGHQSGNAAQGAAIGAATGGVAGGVYGTRQDSSARADRDTYGFAPSDYIAVMTPAELDILRARTSSREADTMADHLTAEEKNNLRRRAADSGLVAE